MLGWAGTVGATGHTIDTFVGADSAWTLDSPSGVAVDSTGVVYIADSGNHRILKVATDETITTFAGTGYPAPAGTGAKRPPPNSTSPMASRWPAMAPCT